MVRRSNAFANFFLIVFLISSIIAIIYAMHRSEFYSPGVMSKFYIIFIFGIFLCLFITKLRPHHKSNVVLLMISLFSGIYLVEIYLYYCSVPNLTNLYSQSAKAAGIPFDSRTRYQAYLDLVKAGADAYPRINVAQFLGLNGLEHKGEKIFPFGGVAKKTTLVCNETGDYFIYQSDEHGFNNPLGLYNPGYIDIALIGDSFTHGFCTSPGQDVAGQLRKTGKTIINLGYGGNGPLAELAVLKEYGEILRPKVVLWMYYEGNDLEDLAVEQQSSTLLNYLNRDFSQNLHARQAEVDKALILYLDEQIERFKKKGTEDDRLTLNIKLIQIIRLYHLRKMLSRITSPQLPAPQPSPLFEKILKESKERTLSWGGTLYFVYLPAWQRYGTAVNHGTLFHRDRVLSTIASLEIPIIDVHEAFSQHPDPLSFFPFRLPGHYVAEGYARVASIIRTYLEAKRAIAVIL